MDNIKEQIHFGKHCFLTRDKEGDPKEPIMAIEINDILIGPNGHEYRIDRFVDDAESVILQSIDTEHVNIIKIPVAEIKSYTVKNKS